MKTNGMPPNGKPSLEQQEAEVPSLAAEAVRRAYEAALDAGQTVLASGMISGRTVLYEIGPDRNQRILKELPARTAVEPGKKLEIK